MSETERDTDSTWAAETSNAMWANLGRQIADAIPDLVIEGSPQKAILWATCAEACFWKATGECDTHDVKDVLPPPAQRDMEAGR